MGGGKGEGDYDNLFDLLVLNKNFTVLHITLSQLFTASKPRQRRGYAEHKYLLKNRDSSKYCNRDDYVTKAIIQQNAKLLLKRRM